MKLAEALIEKKDLTSRIQELQSRYAAAAVVEENTKPDESPEELLGLLQAAFLRWETLTVAINVTNNVTPVGDNQTMMQALAHRDSLKSQIGNFHSIVGSIRQRNQDRRFYGQANAPKMVVSEGVEVKTFIKLKDDLSKELRVLDTQIQAVNWTTELAA